jgi:hypothetical protein
MRPPPITNATITTRMMAQKAQRLQMQRVQSLGTYPRHEKFALPLWLTEPATRLHMQWLIAEMT